MKKMLVFLSLMVLVLLMACNANENEGGKADTNGANDNGEVTLKIFNAKIEIVEQLKQLKVDYEAENPSIILEFESISGNEYNTKLKSKFAGGEMPDIFMNEGYTELDNWVEHLEDLSNEPWVSDIVEVAREPMQKDDKTYGMPLNLEGIGFAYNKDLFEDAGITELPVTLSALKEVSKTLEDNGVLAFTNNFDGFFPLAMHALNNPMAKQPDPNAFINELNEGTATFADNELFRDWTDLLDLFLAYGNKDGLTTDHNTARTNFILGEMAMMQTGNWNDSVIVEMDSDMNLGFLPMPINDDESLNDNIFVGVANNWVIYKDSPHKDEAKDFLNWLVTSETGKRYITDEFIFIPGLTSIEASNDSLGPIAREIVKYVNEDKVLGWHWSKYPEGSLQLLGESIQKYLGGKVDKDEMLAEFDSSWKQLMSKN